MFRQIRNSLLLVAALVAWSAGAAAETQSIRIARNLGLGYLQLYVAQELGLVEKHARALVT